MFGHILVEFLFRLTFGVAAAMGLTPSRQVTGGFFRVHLWVLLGVQTLAALAIYSGRPTEAGTAAANAIWTWQIGLAIGAAVVSYFGAVLWMYDQRMAGKAAIWVVAALTIIGCTMPLLLTGATGTKPVLMQVADRVSSGLLLGLVTTAMLLGHWYLNTPTMQLAPLRRLIVLLAAAVIVRMIVSGSGLALEATFHLDAHQGALTTWALFLSLRWLAGLFGVLGLAWLTRQTLKIPNTQSATGILYAGVILVFIGELTSLLLSAEATWPV